MRSCAYRVCLCVPRDVRQLSHRMTSDATCVTLCFTLGWLTCYNYPIVIFTMQSCSFTCIDVRQLPNRCSGFFLLLLLGVFLRQWLVTSDIPIMFLSAMSQLLMNHLAYVLLLLSGHTCDRELFAAKMVCCYDFHINKHICSVLLPWSGHNCDRLLLAVKMVCNVGCILTSISVV